MHNPKFDLPKARRETPACEDILHFNNAGAALMPEPVIKSLLEYAQLEGRIGGYEAAEQEDAKIQNLYQAGARLLNCTPDEIAFVESATRGWDMAFYSIPFQKGDVIVTGMAEYESNYLAFLQVSKKVGVKIEVIPNDESGQICLKTLREKLNKRVKLIAITHIPTNGGLVDPAEEIGAIAKDANVLYLLDSCQAAGQISLDVRKIGCDFLSFTGRKYIRGPRGTGILYVKRSLCEQLEPPFVDLQAAEWIAKDQYTLSPSAKRFEQWECNYGAKLALGVAMEYANGWGMNAIEHRVTSLAERLRARLKGMPRVQLLDLGARRCGIISFNLKGYNAADVKKALSRSKINISVSSKRYTYLDMNSRNIDSLCRASIHYYNTDEEIERFCIEVEKLSP